MKTCCILLSTYNGQKFLKEQLESLYLQKTTVKIKVFIRDDGSNDKTQDIITEFSKQHQDFEIILKKETNIGVHKSFLKMMRIAPLADYYAFCDQDDFWKEDKIETAVSKLTKFEDKPALYYSNFDIVDSNLNLITKSNIVERGVTDSVTQILFQNRVPGCTIVFNRKLLEKVNCIDIDTVSMHDAYVLAIAYLTGVVIGDTNSMIMYRQHDNNTVGYRKKFPGIKKWIHSKLKLIRCGEEYSMSEIAKAIIQYHEKSCTEKQLLELKQIENYPYNVKDCLGLFFSSQTTSKTKFRSTLSIKCKILLRII